MFSIYSWTFACKPFLQSCWQATFMIISRSLKRRKALLKISVIEAWDSTLDSSTLFLFMSQTRSHSGEWAPGTTTVGLKEGHRAYHWLFVFLNAPASLDFKLSVSHWVIYCFSNFQIINDNQWYLTKLVGEIFLGYKYPCYVNDISRNYLVRFFSSTSDTSDSSDISNIAY